MSSEPSIRERAAKALCDAHHHNDNRWCPDETCDRSERDADVVLAVVADWIEDRAISGRPPFVLATEVATALRPAAVLRPGVSDG